MVYAVEPKDLDSIVEPEVVFGTTKLLPPLEVIPSEFHDSANLYVQVVTAVFYGWPMPNSTMEFRQGFEQAMVVRTVRAHLASFEPQHQHKIAGVAFLLSQMAIVQQGNP